MYLRGCWYKSAVTSTGNLQTRCWFQELPDRNAKVLISVALTCAVITRRIFCRQGATKTLKHNVFCVSPLRLPLFSWFLFLEMQFVTLNV
jgi:hypothetical protein